MVKFKSKNDLIIQEFEKNGLTNYYLQIFDEECKLTIRINLLLKFIGVNSSRKGYIYLSDALEILVNAKSHVPTQFIYEDISKKRCTSRIAVERAIAEAKKQALVNMSESLKMLIFGNILTDKPPSNSTFIHVLLNFMSSFEV